VGINLFITAFKFQRRLGEVVLAVLPFLGAMFVALFLVTYVPGITWTPPPPRESPVSALAEVVHEGYLAATAVDLVTTASGKVLQKSDCDAMTNDADKDNCLGLFEDVS